jgi:hypothetical protein
LDFPCTAHTSFPERLSNHCQGLCRTFSEICTFDIVPLLAPSRNSIRQDTRLQIKGRKNQQIHSSAWNFVHRVPIYANTVTYHCSCCTVLLYRWQHQSWKLWIPPYLNLRYHILKMQFWMFRYKPTISLCSQSLFTPIKIKQLTSFTEVFTYDTIPIHSTDDIEGTPLEGGGSMPHRLLLGLWNNFC